MITVPAQEDRHRERGGGPRDHYLDSRGPPTPCQRGCRDRGNPHIWPGKGSWASWPRTPRPTLTRAPTPPTGSHSCRDRGRNAPHYPALELQGPHSGPFRRVDAGGDPPPVPPYPGKIAGTSGRQGRVPPGDPSA